MIRTAPVLLSAALALAPAHAGELFEDDAPIAITLEGPISKVRRDPADEPRYRPFILRTSDEVHAIRVKPRGASRRDICGFPPLRINFDDVETGVFAGQDKLKLVTHCGNTPRAEQNVLEEYAAYRILNALTPASFRVRLLTITYVDDGARRSRSLTRWGFVIEDVEALAVRLGGTHIEPRYLPPARLEPAHTTLVGLFQFAIGNTDWVPNARRPGQDCCHNAKLIEVPAGILSVPYDFDQSGIVDAAYAGPNPVHDADDVRRRHYLGTCSSVAHLTAAFQAFQARRETIIASFEDVPGMHEATRKRARRYIEGFFERVDIRGVEPLHDRCR